jgi:integrase
VRFAQCQPNTIVRQLITPLTAVLNYAAQPGREWCKAPAFIRPEYDDERRRYARYDEADRLLQAAVSANPRVAKDIQQWQLVYLRTLLLFFMMTGARMSEALKLRWEDVNLQERWLVFRSTKRNKKPRTKRAMLRADDRGGEDRGVPIHLQLRIALANLPGDHKTGPVFLTRRGRGYAINAKGQGQIKKAWAGVCQRAGIEDLTPHDLRRSCATWLTAAFVHDQVRDEIIGHKVSSMGRRYSQVPNPDHIAAIDKLPWRKLDVDEAPAAASRGKPVELA